VRSGLVSWEPHATLAARKPHQSTSLGRPVERVGHRDHGDPESVFTLLLALSWSRLGLALFGLYVGLNSVFATLYWIAPGALVGSSGSFADSFFFSVQTLATIGYGGISPTGLWSNGLVSVESFVGILFSALATGVSFAKFARPRPRVLFSQGCVVHDRDGVPTLCFRVGNLRGVEIVEATIKVSALRTHVTSEGERMRRFYDLTLERDRSPLFALSWLVMHRIDASSPLHGLDHEALLKDDVRLLVSMTGIDEAYGQHVYTRYNYDAKHMHFGARFVDVLEPLPGGGLRFAFDKFHSMESGRVSLAPVAPVADRAG